MVFAGWSGRIMTKIERFNQKSALSVKIIALFCFYRYNYPGRYSLITIVPIELAAGSLCTALLPARFLIFLPDRSLL
jgi:hypothetical protein